MATRKSLVHSQDIVVCQLCEINSKIKVKCIDCKLLMCEKCKDKVHSKFKNADLHEIIGLSEIASYEHRKLNEKTCKPVQCPEHRSQICCMYCKRCEQLVCTKCISQKHQKHELSEIDDAFLEMEKLNKFSVEIANHLSDDLRKLHTMKKTTQSKYSEICEAILKEETHSKNKVHMHYVGKLTNLEQQKYEIVKELSEKENQIEKRRRDITETRNQLDILSKSNDIETFVKTVSTFDAKLRAQEVLRCTNAIEMKSLQYIPGHVSITSESSTKSIKTAFSKTKTFETVYENISSMTIDNHGILWICCGKCIHQIDPSNQFQTIGTFVLPSQEIPKEIRWKNPNELFLTVSSNLQLLDAKRKFKTVTKLSPLNPLTLHISKTNDLVIGMDYRGAANSLNQPILVIIGSRGQTKAEYLNTAGNPLLLHHLVQSITSFEDGTFCYSDSDWNILKGRAVKLDSEGNVEWVYDGNAEINNLNYFMATEVVTTVHDNLIISDKYCNILHILTSNGELISLIDTKMLEIEYPGNIVLEKNGSMWINSNATSKATLYHLKYSGF